VKKASGAFYSIINPNSFLFTLIIIFILVFGAASIIAYKHYKSALLYAIAENKSTANLLSSLVYEHQKAATSILESYAQRPLFIDAIQRRDFHHVLYHLKSLNEHHTEMDALFISDQYGTVWANYPESTESYGKNFAYRDWYKGVSKKWRPYISTIFRLIVLEKGLAVAVSVPVFDRKGKVIGIFGSTQRTFFLATFIRANTLNPRKNITLLDQEGNIIFSNTVPYQEKITKYPDAHVLEKALAGVIIDMEISDAHEKGSISYVSIAPVRGIGWSVIVGQEKNAILKQLYGYFIVSTVTGFVIFLLISVSLLYFRREYRYRKTKELLQAEEKYRNIVNDAILGIYQTTPEGRFLSANPALARMYGYDTPEELINSVVDLATQSYVNPEDREIFKRIVLREGVVEKFETRLHKKGGEIIWVSINAHTVKDTQGNISSYEGTIEDITERKRMEEEIWRHNEELTALNAIAIMVNSSLDLQQILDQTLDKVLEITKMEVGSLYLTDPQTEELVLSTYRGVSKEFGDQVRTFKLGESIVGLAAQSGKPIVADDLTGDPRVTTTLVSGEGIRSLAAIPMKSKNKVQGMINIASYTCHSFTNEEIDFYTAIANQIGVAIENARLYEAVQRELTERKQAEEALRESGEKYRSLFEESRDIIYITTKEGKFIDINQAGLELFGYTKEELMSLNVQETYANPDDRPRFQQEIERKGFVRDFEIKLCKKDGTEMDCLLTSILRQAIDGSILGYQGIIRDITERKRAGEALWESEERFRRLSEASFEGIVFHEEGKIIDANEAFATMLGYGLSEVIGKNALDFATPELREVALGHIRDGSEEPYDGVAIRKDGSTFLIEVRGKHIPYKGRTIRLTAMRDITERKRAEEALRESEASYRELADSIVDVFFAFDKDLRYTYWNKASEELTGIPAKDAIGKSLYELFPETPETKRAEMVYLDVLRTQKNQSFVNEYRWGERNFWFEISVYPSVDGISVFTRDITECKQAEEALRESEERYRTILDNTQYGYFEVDIAGNFTFFNDSLCIILGYPRDEMMGMNNRQYMDKENSKKVYQAFNRVYTTGEPYLAFDWEIVRKDGAKRFVETLVSLIRNSKGEGIGFRGIGRDITERKRTEETLRETQELLTSILDNAPMLIYVTLPDNRYRLVNRGWEEFVRLTREEAVGRLIEQVFSPKTACQFIEANQQVIDMGIPVVAEEFVDRSDGPYYFHTVKFPLRDTTGKVTSVGGISFDITERKRAEEVLRESEVRFRSVFNNAFVGIALVNRQGHVLEVNEAYCRFLGYSREELIGMHFAEFTHPEDLSIDLDLYDALIEDERYSYSSDKRYMRKGKVVWGRLAVSLIKDEAGQPEYTLIVCEDITERKRAEEALRQAEENFRRSLDESPLGARIVSANGETLYANRAILEIYGYDSIEELRTTPVKKRYTPESYAEFQIRKKKRQQGEYDPPEYEISIVRENGEVRHLQVFRKEVLWNGEKQYQAIYLDITERKWAEEALQASKELFEKTFVSQRDAIFLLDAINPPTILDCNPAATEIFGYTRQEMVGRTMDFLHVNEAALKEFQEHLYPTLFESGFLHQFKFRMKRKNGAIYHTEHSVTQLKDEQDKGIGWVSVVRDITERKQAEEKLAEREMFNFALFQYNPIQTIVVDLEGKVVGWNLAKKKSDDRLPNIGDVMYRDYAGSYEIDMYTELMECIRSGEIREFPEQKYGNKVLSITISPFFEGAVIISQDITERKWSEERILTYQEQLRSLASELSLIEERERRHIATELHDNISQTLAITKIKLGMAQGLTSSTDWVGSLNEIGELVDQAIQYTRSLTFELSPPILYELGFEAAAEWLTEQIQEQHHIEIGFEDDRRSKPMSEEIRIALFKATKELLINIVKHAQASKAKVSIWREDNSIRIRVEDDGVGFSTSEGKALGKTTGFGLFNIRERMKYIGGDMVIESEPGRGTRVTLSAPLEEE
jgi:PAS domain S-box-containing protein